MNIKIVIASVAAVALSTVGIYAAYCIHDQQEHHRLKRALAAMIEVCGQRRFSTSVFCFQCPQDGILQHLRARPETLDQQCFLRW